MARSRSDRLSAALKALEKTYGPVPVLPEGNPMDQLMVLFLFREGSSAKARAAVENLTREFVDWNEVRISWSREVASPLSAAGFPEALELARSVLEFLDKIYRERNAVNLGFFSELDPEDAFAWLRSLAAVDDGTAAAVVSLFIPPPEILAVPEILRIAGRLGIAGKDSTPARARKALEAAALGPDRIRMHYLFARHSEEICRSRSPRCAECDANGVCDYGKTQVTAAAAAPAKEKAEKAGRAKRAGNRSKASGRVAKKPASAGKKSGVAKKKPPAARTAAGKKAPLKKKSGTKKAAGGKAPAKRKATKKAAGKKAAPKKPAAKKAAPKRAAPKKAAPKKAAPKKAASARRSAAASSAGKKKPRRRS